MGDAEPYWLTAFLDLPAAGFEPAVEFWSRLTGYAVSAWRGDHDEFATLLPPNADAHLKVQRLSHGGPRVHLDVHVSDPGRAARVAQEHGAQPHGNDARDLGYVTLRSPGGLTFCFVSHRSSQPAEPGNWPGGRSMVDQVCIDIRAADYDRECDFWSVMLGQPWRPSPTHPEFRRIPRPGQPLQVLLQRLEESTTTRAHLDLCADDRRAEVLRHEECGAQVEAEFDHWTVLRDPLDQPYCITDRSPT